MEWREARWPLGIAAVAGGWYASDSLRHRREGPGTQGYELHGNADLDVGEAEFMRAAEVLTGAPISTGDDVELLINGDRIFPAFLDTISRAEHTINLLTYAYWRGEICDDMADALVGRVQEGVEVNVLLDAIGTLKMERRTIERLEQGGVRVARFRPLKPYALRRATNRTHRKVLVADGRIGMIGGVGIAQEWTGDAQDPDHWRDTHVRVRGPIVRGLQGAFAENWLEATGEVLAGPHHLPDLDPVEDGSPMQVVRSTAGIGDTEAEALYFMAIASAKRSIELTAAYFAPRPAFTEALCDAADRGVDVRVLVPGPHIDKEFVRLAGRASYEQLLACGVRIWEYQPTMLHAKTLVVDGAWASVGSINFDNRSFQLHDEATLCVQSDGFAGRLHDQFERDLAVSEEMDAGRWGDRPRWQRARESALLVVRREL
jgi:cardiolipin synthase